MTREGDRLERVSMSKSVVEYARNKNERKKRCFYKEKKEVERMMFLYQMRRTSSALLDKCCNIIEDIKSIPEARNLRDKIADFSLSLDMGKLRQRSEV